MSRLPDNCAIAFNSLIGIASRLRRPVERAIEQAQHGLGGQTGDVAGVDEKALASVADHLRVARGAGRDRRASGLERLEEARKSLGAALGAGSGPDGKARFDWWGAGHDTEEEGYYIRIAPLADAPDLDAYDWPDPHDPHLLDDAKALRERVGDRAFRKPCLELFDLGLAEEPAVSITTDRIHDGPRIIPRRAA